MIARVHRVAARAWLALAGGGGCAFVARDLFGMPAGLVVLAWIAGAVAGLFLSPRPPGGRHV